MWKSGRPAILAILAVSCSWHVLSIGNGEGVLIQTGGGIEYPCSRTSLGYPLPFPPRENPGPETRDTPPLLTPTENITFPHIS